MNILEAFKAIWPQRQGTANIASEEDMKRYMIIELKDELTHPRVRKTKQQKLALAIERINGSQLGQQEKQQLIEEYKKIAAQLD